MEVREMFELIEELVNKYGYDKVKFTINSIFSMMETIDYINGKEKDKEVKLFYCGCDCKQAIKETMYRYDIEVDDYTKVLTDVKKWIEWVCDEED